jgi:hypothetical protein
MLFPADDIKDRGLGSLRFFVQKNDGNAGCFSTKKP